jgi:hypothetical protein
MGFLEFSTDGQAFEQFAREILFNLGLHVARSWARWGARHPVQSNTC